MELEFRGVRSEVRGEFNCWDLQCNEMRCNGLCLMPVPCEAMQSEHAIQPSSSCASSRRACYGTFSRAIVHPGVVHCRKGLDAILRILNH